MSEDAADDAEAAAMVLLAVREDQGRLSTWQPVQLQQGELDGQSSGIAGGDLPAEDHTE